MPGRRVREDHRQLRGRRLRAHDDRVLRRRRDREAGEQERRVALQVLEPPQRPHDVGRGQRRAVGEVDVPLELEGVGLRVRARLERRDEQRNRMRQIAALVREERVVERVVDQGCGGIERPPRVRGLDRERVVDDERVRRRACGGAVGDEHRCGHEGRRERRDQRRAPTAESFHSSCSSVAVKGRGQAYDAIGRRHRRQVGRVPPERLRSSPRAAASRPPSGRRRAPRAAAPRRCSARTRTGSADGSGSRSAAGRDRAPRREATSGRKPLPVRVGNRVDQRLAVGVERLLPEPAGRPGLDHAAEVHDRDGVGDVADDRQVVRDEEQPQAELAREADEQVRELRLGGGVERRERLVEHEHGRVGGQGAGDRDALPLPARELVREPLGRGRREPDDLAQLLDAGRRARRPGRGRACRARRRAGRPPSGGG